ASDHAGRTVGTGADGFPNNSADIRIDARHRTSQAIRDGNAAGLHHIRRNVGTGSFDDERRNDRSQAQVHLPKKSPVARDSRSSWYIARRVTPDWTVQVDACSLLPQAGRHQTLLKPSYGGHQNE